MTSLRSRLVLIVLVLSAAGLVALAAVTYVDQRSFLEGRVNGEARGAGLAVSRALDLEGVGPQGAGSDAPGTRAGGSGQPPAPGEFGPGPGQSPGRAGGSDANLNLPPGTYGQRRDASGKVLGHLLVSYGETAPAAPKIPAKVPVGRLFTVGSVGSSGLRYRVYVIHDPEDSGLTLVAVPLHEVQQTLSRLLVVEALVIVAVLLALGVASFFVVRIGLRPLDRMSVAADAIAAGELSRRVEPADRRSEVGHLGLALNAMLARLEQAFAQRQASEERLRRFLADSSHELRTPLAAIRGYAELFRMGATRDAAGTEQAMRRIEQESKRMGVLVEDMLKLARLDETTEPVREPVDLSELARNAVEDAHATAPERAISLAAPSALMISGDPDQLTQVLANLLRNALMHTPAGTAIEVRLNADERLATLEVRDHGPGFPEGSAELLFERFWRAAGGRERGSGGAGLGLAIVAGIVAAHGGSVSASNAPGGGAQFTVRLPRAPATPATPATPRDAADTAETAPAELPGAEPPGAVAGERSG